MKIATWNVNGIRARCGELQHWVRDERPDVLCLQEIKVPAGRLPFALCELDGYWCHWHGTRAYSGVALHVREDLAAAPPSVLHPPFAFEERMVAVDLGWVVVASVYVPNGGKDFPAKTRFLDDLTRYAADLAAHGRWCVICGDLNVTHREIDVHPRERKPGVIGQRPEERAQLDGLLARGLVDLGRALDPDNDGLFTWWAPWREMRRRNIGWRLDYILVSAALARFASSCEVRALVGTSDHAPVVATFDSAAASARWAAAAGGPPALDR